MLRLGFSKVVIAMTFLFGSWFLCLGAVSGQTGTALVVVSYRFG